MAKIKEIVDARNAKGKEMDALRQKLETQVKGKYPNIKKLTEVLGKNRHGILHRGPFDALRQIEALVAMHANMSKDVAAIKSRIEVIKSRIEAIPEDKDRADKLAKLIQRRRIDETPDYEAYEQQAAVWLQRLTALGIVGKK
jgi:hypothetical protein